VSFEPSPTAARISAEPAKAMTGVRTLGHAAAYVVFVTLTISPLLWASVPPIGDYPNHLARMWILAHGQEIPELAANYVAHWRLLPNLAMDLVVPPLARVMPVEIAGRLFIALTMLGLISGTLTLHRVLHGRVGFWPLCSLPFVYNLALFFGLLNFLFGVGAFLLAFSGWIATPHWRIIPRLLTFAAIASLLFTLHLFAFGLYALSVMSYELQDRIYRRSSTHSLISWCVIGLQFLPAVVLWLISLPESGATYTAYGGLGAKMLALLSPWSFGHLVALDGEFIILYLSFLVYACVSRSLKLAPPMRLPLAALGIATVLMPQWLSGSGAADIRLPVTLPFLIIASTRLAPSRQLVIHAFAMAAVLLLGLRLWAISESWRDYDRQFAEFRAASAVISPGARLLIVRQFTPESHRRLADISPALALRSDQVYRHMAALAVIDRSAFIPFLLSGWTTVEPTKRNAGLFQTQGNTITPEMLADSITTAQMELQYREPNGLGELAYWGDWPKHFDYVLWIDFGERPARVPENLQTIATGSFFRIYRVLQP
jgi:hypothetical protein